MESRVRSDSKEVLRKCHKECILLYEVEGNKEKKSHAHCTHCIKICLIMFRVKIEENQVDRFLPLLMQHASLR